MALNHFPPTAGPAEVSDHLRRFGYAIVDDVADPALLDRLEAEAMLHGAGANTSDGVRRGVNITYAVGWVRQEENQYLPEVARTLDDDLLRMMGYTQGAFALGYVGDQTDPLAALRGSGVMWEAFFTAGVVDTGYGTAEMPDPV